MYDKIHYNKKNIYYLIVQFVVLLMVALEN